MSEDSAQDAGGRRTGRNPENKKNANKSRAASKRSTSVPDEGRIPHAGPSIVQTILAVAFLILVTLVSFGAVFIIGELTTGNRQTYWMIELLFALLCGGAGALVGGSAVVRSTLRIPGSPVHATLGGAISMVIVGFALAYLGQPPEDQPMYAVEIHKIPDRKNVGDLEYLVHVGAATQQLSFSRDSENVLIKIPPKIGARYRFVIAVYRPIAKDMSQLFAKCELTFETLDGQRNAPTAGEVVLHQNAPQFHLYLSEKYIEKAVTAALQRKESVTTEPCVEGHVRTKDDMTLLGGSFKLQPNNPISRAWSFAQLSPMQRYSVLASNRSYLDPQDTLPDLPPQVRPVPGMVATPPASTTGEAPARQQPVPPSTVIADATSGIPKPEAPPAPSTPVAESAPTRAESDAAVKNRTLNEQIDAYVRGEDQDRTQLYQSWGQVAEYVVRGLRAEHAKDSNLVGRYLNLISNALNVIENGRYLPPTLRPNWDQSIKPDRLSKNWAIPGFSPSDYKIVVDSVCSRDEDVRRAAQRLLKLYPSYHFYAHLQALPKQPTFNGCKPTFVAETAAYYFYNRIVEYDGTFTLDKSSMAWINENYAEGVEWAKRGEAQDGAFGMFAAMLDYARGLVLWDHGEKKDASASFSQMIDSIRASSRIYPSNPQHIATALRVIHEPGRSSKSVSGAVVFNPPDRRAVARAYVVTDGAVDLFAVPDSSKRIGKMKSDAVARVYLRLNTWELLEAGGQIGWAQRVGTSAAR